MSFNPSLFNNLYDSYADYLAHEKKSNFKWMLITKHGLSMIAICLQRIWKGLNQFVLSSLQYTGMMWMHYHVMDENHTQNDVNFFSKN